MRMYSYVALISTVTYCQPSPVSVLSDDVTCCQPSPVCVLSDDVNVEDIHVNMSLFSIDYSFRNSILFQECEIQECEINMNGYH